MAKKKKGGFLGVPGLSFSLSRAVGLSALKGKVSRATGIPTTKGGRERKVGRIVINMVKKVLL